MKTKVKIVLSCYVVSLIALFILSLFPGYNDFVIIDNCVEWTKTVPVGYFYSHIAYLLNQKFVLGEGSYTPAQSIISGLASLYFLALFFVYAVLSVVFTIKRKKLFPISLSFVFMFIAHIPTMILDMRLVDPTINSAYTVHYYRFEIAFGVIALVALLIDLVRLTIWLYRKYPPKPRPRKPTSKERIAELEARVRELENKKDG